jgi:hypothetical protein
LATTLTNQIYADDVVETDNIREIIAVIHLKFLLCFSPFYQHGRDSVFGIATCHELDGSGIESRGGRNFSQPSRLALGPTRYNGYWVYFVEIKRPERGIEHPRTSNAKVEERVELYISTPPQFLHGLL